MIGKRIGERYEILSYIGGGGMSRVYLARDIILDRNVAVKVLNYDFSNEEELKHRFMREALSATSLTHPHIVNIFDVGEDGEIHYLVMEYIEGQTLKEFIVSKGPLSPEVAVPIMRQLVAAISNAHYNGIIHRDIKPQNILMDKEGNVKITDFGIAMALSATAYTKTNSVLGTVHYLSPEQARGGMATKKSDIYSLGIVFYELLAGKLPFSGESAVSIALKHLQEETPSVRALFPTIPQSVENVILKATAKDASTRYLSADDMQNDLSTVLSPERANEDLFTVPFDDQATRAIPIIKDESQFENIENTKKHEPVQVKTSPLPVKKKKKWPFIIGGLVATLLLLILVIVLINVFSTKQVEIPDVIDLTEAEAVIILEGEGFRVDESIEQPSDEIEAGKVIKTSPETGRKRDVGTEVKLYVSIGKEKIDIENYVGEDYNQIASLLANYGYKSIKADEEFSDKPEGTILEQNPTAGEEIIPSDTDLVFVVSKGRDMRTLENLKGFNKDELTEYAKTSGFNITIVREDFSSTVQQGRVISQKPAAGEVEKTQKVEVILSKGAEKKPVRHIVKSVTIPYLIEESSLDSENEEEETEVEDITNIPQTIRIYIQDRKHTMADTFEEFTITKDTVKRITIELEEGQKGAYKIMRDNTLIAEETFNYGDAD